MQLGKDRTGDLRTTLIQIHTERSIPQGGGYCSWR